MIDYLAVFEACILIYLSIGAIIFINWICRDSESIYEVFKNYNVNATKAMILMGIVFIMCWVVIIVHERLNRQGTR